MKFIHNSLISVFVVICFLTRGQCESKVLTNNYSVINKKKKNFEPYKIRVRLNRMKLSTGN